MIQLVNQIDDETCGAACVAMIAHVSIDKVISIMTNLNEQALIQI